MVDGEDSGSNEPWSANTCTGSDLESYQQQIEMVSAAFLQSQDHIPTQIRCKVMLLI